MENLKASKKKGEVTIESTSGWYFTGGKPPNPDRVIAMFVAMVDRAVANGKKAIRIFGDMSSFFKHGFDVDLLKYESMLGERFDLQLIGVCAFLTDAVKSYNPKQLEQLKNCHDIVLTVANPAGK